MPTVEVIDFRISVTPDLPGAIIVAGVMLLSGVLLLGLGVLMILRSRPK